jgi:hypothetical protein
VKIKLRLQFEFMADAPYARIENKRFQHREKKHGSFQ